jgi:GNAT superfamily N-acetyltransferase
MQLELVLSNESRSLPSVRGMTVAALEQLPLEPGAAAPLAELVVQAVNDAIAQAYPPGESGEIRLTIRERQSKLEILIRDYGLPQDVEALEQQLHRGGEGARRWETAMAAAVDEVHWLGFGREGKALQILKWLPGQSITESAPAESLVPFQSDAALAPEQDYVIRRLQPEEAVQVCQLMYRAYGNTYFNEDVYYPQRVAAQNTQNVNLSFVAVGAAGRIAGHYALERNQDGPVAEGGQAVVDPAHRGRGLLERLKAAAVEEAQRLGLAGWYADAVSVHTLTQRSNATHGGKLTAVDLAIAPSTERFRNLAGEQPQRVTCLLYFHWLQAPTPRTVYIPEGHQEIVAEIYQALGCPVAFGDGAPASGHGTIAIKADPGGRKAFIRAGQLGADTAAAIRHARRELVERSHMEAIYAELPAEDPGASAIAKELAAEGFGFLGMAPHFSPQGDLLRLGYLTEPLERGPIQTYDAFAARLCDYVLADQRRSSLLP